ncbi:hypothetical protein N7532_006806 [Penicillium argentinense]|uniref:Transcription elongation factor SPT4 n=1 Tax=Penicillium argentinense TaxID=1131581 RepID=A0A9W9FGR7_9EURO|nr:uncharacterized protein N7532_006806 [Penicillium argentinense]KAJ5099805.1 hypothetical protein N7532_006806 [Penicillium argentinense]
MSFYVASNQQRSLRACMVCSVVQPVNKFMRDGCPNCENVLQLRGNNDAVQECTSQVFEGLIAVRDPANSWVARWQRLDNYVPGTYATMVTGSLPDYILSSLEDAGIKYVPYAPHYLSQLNMSRSLWFRCADKYNFRRDGSTGEEES